MIVEDDDLHVLIGRAIEAYALVEAQQALLVEQVLNIDTPSAFVICFAAENVRFRCGMISSLLQIHNTGFVKYWKSCSTFLEKLAEFRNALAHWHPILNVCCQHLASEKRYSMALYDPKLRKTNFFLAAEHIPPFLEDCSYIFKELTDLTAAIKDHPQSPPQKYNEKLRKNRAVLENPSSNP